MKKFKVVIMIMWLVVIAIIGINDGITYDTYVICITVMLSVGYLKEYKR